MIVEATVVDRDGDVHLVRSDVIEGLIVAGSDELAYRIGDRVSVEIEGEKAKVL